MIMQMRRRWTGLLAIMGAAAVLSGCANKGPQVACPTVDVVDALHQTTAFKAGAIGDLSAVLHLVEIADFAATCRVSKDQISLPIKVRLIANRGPANVTDDAEVAYFVAILDAAENVVTKQVYQARVPFDGGSQRVAIDEEFMPVLPYKSADERAGYRVLIGLQVDRATLQYQRSRRQ
jgi:hypothetical protein